MATTTFGLGGFSTILSVLGTAITTAYTGNQIVFDCHSADSVVMDVNYTKGGETNVNVQVEVWNGSVWAVVPYSHFTASSPFNLTMSASATKRWVIARLATRFERQVRVSVKSASAGSANSTTAVVIKMQLGNPQPLAAGL